MLTMSLRCSIDARPPKFSMTIRETIALVFAALALSSFPSTQVVGCGAGWFGSSCQYKCRCSLDLCHQNGSCRDGYLCQQGWFGPACQYTDVAFNRSLLVELTDGSDQTCLVSGTSVDVVLDQPYVFTWLRLHLRNNEPLEELSLQFRQNSTTFNCSNERKATVDRRTIDIYCDLHSTVQVVSLSGAAVKYLCSLYVSGGRNVALRQPTRQSSTLSEPPPSTYGVLTNFTADKAVDGNTNRDFYSGKSCSSTQPGTVNTSWTITFLKPQLVSRYVFYTALGQGHRITQFSYDALGIMVFRYEGASIADSKSVYTTVSLGVLQLVSEVKVEAHNINVLVMCEVQIYGDSNCLTGRFGRECENNCTCDEDTPCLVSTGLCPRGCGPGFTGSSCEQMCGLETYGYGCGFVCSAGCKRHTTTETTTCNHSTGACTFGCSLGFSDPWCCTDIRGVSTFRRVMIVSVPAILLLMVLTAALAFCLKQRQLHAHSARPHKAAVRQPVHAPQPVRPVGEDAETPAAQDEEGPASVQGEEPASVQERKGDVGVTADQESHVTTPYVSDPSL